MNACTYIRIYLNESEYHFLRSLYLVKMIPRKLYSMFNVNPETDYNYPYRCYRTTTNFVERLVNLSIENALKIISNMQGPIYLRGNKYMRKMGQHENEWPTCGSFTIPDGLESVINEMESWNALPALKDWMFHATFIGLEHKLGTEFYTYEILWSVPTPAYPEPQVTVSVFFYIATNPIYPRHYPIDVSYGFEGYQFLHKLNMIFRPKFLYDILDMKTMMFKTFDF
ncbi:A-kinase anchor protein 14 [Ptiloglossa arizonensis]|uniref:A-kinase anchor protein 14 n=1 Tax=Ptiloglossa arizonensis TaxID=3350558 RepID=UPI003F9F8872